MDINTSEPAKEERRLILQALRYIGGPQHPFPGYYEFDVLGKEQIMFRNYQHPGSWTK
jgi:hypothetical protein